MHHRPGYGQPVRCTIVGERLTQRAVKVFRSSPGRRPAAVRSTLTAVGVALAASALGSALFTVALHDTVGSGLITFAIFGSLAALSAGVLAWELASLRVRPRCGYENTAMAACAACGYDVRERSGTPAARGIGVAFDPGMCDCGRRLLALRPVPVASTPFAPPGSRLVLPAGPGRGRAHSRRGVPRAGSATAAAAGWVGGRVGARGRGRSGIFGAQTVAWHGVGVLGSHVLAGRGGRGPQRRHDGAPPLRQSGRAWMSSMRRWPVGSGGGQLAVGSAGQPPPALMDRPVVGPAQQGQVRQVGGAAVQPVQQMMALTPGQGPVTVGEDTAAVADGQGGALGEVG